MENREKVLVFNFHLIFVHITKVSRVDYGAHLHLPRAVRDHGGAGP